MPLPSHMSPNSKEYEKQLDENIKNQYREKLYSYIDSFLIRGQLSVNLPGHSTSSMPDYAVDLLFPDVKRIYGNIGWNVYYTKFLFTGHKLTFVKKDRDND